MSFLTVPKPMLLSCPYGRNAMPFTNIINAANLHNTVLRALVAKNREEYVLPDPRRIHSMQDAQDVHHLHQIGINVHPLQFDLQSRSGLGGLLAITGSEQEWIVDRMGKVPLGYRVFRNNIETPPELLQEVFENTTNGSRVQMGICAHVGWVEQEHSEFHPDCREVLFPTPFDLLAWVGDEYHPKNGQFHRERRRLIHCPCSGESGMAVVIAKGVAHHAPSLTGVSLVFLQNGTGTPCENEDQRKHHGLAVSPAHNVIVGQSAKIQEKRVTEAIVTGEDPTYPVLQAMQNAMVESDRANRNRIAVFLGLDALRPV